MTIPKTTYPETIDTNQTLFYVSDGLRVRLSEDYNPGDTSITVVAEESVMRSFNSTGIITLTEQCSEPEFRAISFYYSSRTLTTFDGLELLPGFVDVSKLKDITNVTQNIMSIHHNNLKDALIKIERFAGKKGQEATYPLTGTMEQRINYLRNIVLKPKSWFKADKKIGLQPFKVTFTDQSFRLGTDGSSKNITHTWYFNLLTEEEKGTLTDTVLLNDTTYYYDRSETKSYESQDNLRSNVSFEYANAGNYRVALNVENDFGSDAAVFDQFINVRYPAPDEAVVVAVLRGNQKYTEEGSLDGYQYTTLPIIRALVNTLIDIKIKDDDNPDPRDKTWAGEAVTTLHVPIDQIKNYTWAISDDLSHPSTSSTRCLFGIGGYYDMVLRTDTEFGSYRITTYPNMFDIVESVNLWLWNYSGNLSTGTSSIASYEMGLISETFKNSGVAQNINIDNRFLSTDQQKTEFAKNNGAIQRGTSTSGSGGTALLYWASGRNSGDPSSNEKVKMVGYNGFDNTYSTIITEIDRPWNWVSFASSEKVYFILGGNLSNTANTSLTNQTKSVLGLSTMAVSSETLQSSNYRNGAIELQSNMVTFDLSGNPNEGHMSVYRTAWHNDTGYILRNDAVGDFFRIRSFYKTSGNTSEPFVDIKKLTDMGGSARTEGELISLSQGVYFFNNSGSVVAYGDSSNTWTTSGPGINSAGYRALQDTSVSTFANTSNTLIATSDGDKTAYLSFDYSTKGFIKFSEIDTTFSYVSNRPAGNQWQMYIF